MPRHPMSRQSPSKSPDAPTRRSFLGCLMAAACLAGAPTATAHPGAGRPANASRVQGGNVEIYATRADGSRLSSFRHDGHFYLAGELGERYELHVRNRSAGRMEVVVSVDGRDVLTGEEADYTVHRGYVVPAWGTVTIPGFRRSMDQVAAFRFSTPGGAYSNRMGTPQHVGVIGVAAFKERAKPPTRRPRPTIAKPAPPPRPRPSRSKSRAGTRDLLDSGGGAPTSAPERERASSGRARRDARPTADAMHHDAPQHHHAYEDHAHARPQQLGTAWGENMHDRVRETSFRRRNTRRPDAMIRLDYDSMDGLFARGVVAPPRPHVHAPDPFPGRQFAEPPPGYR